MKRLVCLLVLSTMLMSACSYSDNSHLGTSEHTNPIHNRVDDNQIDKDISDNQYSDTPNISNQEYNDYLPDGKDTRPKEDTPEVKIEYNYYAYKNECIKLYKLIPNIEILYDEDKVTIRLPVNDSITYRDTQLAMDIFLLEYMMIPEESLSRLNTDNLIQVEIPLESFNEYKERYLTDFNLSTTIDNETIKSVRVANDYKELHILVNSDILNRSNDIISIELEYINALMIYNILSGKDADIRVYEVTNEPEFLRSITYDVIDHKDYIGVWNGFDDIGYDTFYIREILNIRFEDTEYGIKVSMPTNHPDLDYDYLLKFYISLYDNLLKTSDALYFTDENDLYCYMTQDEYDRLINDINYRLDNFVLNHPNIISIDTNNSKYTEFEVIDANFNSTSSDYYQYTLLKALQFITGFNNKNAWELDIAIYNENLDLEYTGYCDSITSSDLYMEHYSLSDNANLNKIITLLNQYKLGILVNKYKFSYLDNMVDIALGIGDTDREFMEELVNTLEMCDVYHANGNYYILFNNYNVNCIQTAIDYIVTDTYYDIGYYNDKVVLVISEYTKDKCGIKNKRDIDNIVGYAEDIGLDISFIDNNLSIESTNPLNIDIFSIAVEPYFIVNKMLNSVEEVTSG